ncbi:hypothetical protein SAMN05192533_10182 [Mesobacillus persicus]|uniref:Uncharacterized protein n=1 Tax=Mesobacillus persicus TaxID=930146 RepID=A0A1H7VRI2_9BACI|nr:hypothetical protein [Mesobacillus persicus]SEM11942.1 hypothetical protein SAMN05192533_10182 [Mesobacillus persicus]
MVLFLVLITFINTLVTAWAYLSLNRQRYLFSERFGFTVTFLASTSCSFVLALNLFLLFPTHLEVVSTFTLFLGIVIGALFGSMVNMQSFIAGVFNGGVGGIMGSMLGAVALDPSLCGLPADLWAEQDMMLFMSLLSLGIQLLSASMLTLAKRL